MSSLGMSCLIKVATADGREIELSRNKINLIHGDFASGKSRFLEQDIAAVALRPFDLATSLQNIGSYDPQQFPTGALRLARVVLIGRRGKLAASSLLSYMNLTSEFVQALAPNLCFTCPRCRAETPYYPSMAHQIEAAENRLGDKLVSINAVIARDRLPQALALGFNKILVASNFVELTSQQLLKFEDHCAEICIDRLKVCPENKARLRDATTQAFNLGAEYALIRPLAALTQGIYIGESVACQHCGITSSITACLVSIRHPTHESGWRFGQLAIESLTASPISHLSEDGNIRAPKILAALSLLTEIGLGDLTINTALRHLSPAARQRVRLAQFMLSSPKSNLILLPDLFNDCSPQFEQSLYKSLSMLLDAQNTVVVSSSDSYANNQIVNLIEMSPPRPPFKSTDGFKTAARPRAHLVWIRVDPIGLSHSYLSDLRQDSKTAPTIADYRVIGDFAPESARRVADVLGCSDQLAIFFAALENARIEGLNARSFLQAQLDSRFSCELCHGHGFFRRSISPAGQYIPMRCAKCDGRGVNATESTIRYRGLGFADILALSLSRLASEFQAILRKRRALDAICALGLGELQAHQPMWCLRSSERTAVTLAALPVGESERGATESGTKVVCGDMTSHLSSASLPEALERLKSHFNAHASVYIVSSDARLERIADRVETACSFEQLNATITR